MQAEQLKLLDELEAITSTMDIPTFKLRNVGWLNRNMAIRNSKHPKFDEAMELIRKLLSNGITQG